MALSGIKRGLKTIMPFATEKHGLEISDIASSATQNRMCDHGRLGITITVPIATSAMTAETRLTMRHFLEVEEQLCRGCVQQTSGLQI